MILNFGHPLTREQRQSIRELTGQRISKVIDIGCQFDPQQPFTEQVERLMEQMELSAEDWQTLSILVNPPSFAPISCLLMAFIHGFAGHFPAILRLRPTPGVASQFEVAEIINLQEVRDRARGWRQVK
jgi:hypothetical protein